MIGAVLWDFGGVVTASPFDAFNAYERAHGIPENFIRRINATNPHDNAWAKFERSEVDLAEFSAAFEAESAAAGHPIPGARVIALLSGDVRPEMVVALRRCRERFRIGCLTNNMAVGDGPGMAFSRVRRAAVEEAMALFHVVVESSKVGVRKPDPRIYRIACAELGVAPGDVVYLDDLGINLKPARAMGMTTIKVTDTGQALADLERAIGPPLS